jgi:hypothetical protein
MTPREIVDVELNAVRFLFDTQKEIHPMAVFVRDGEHNMLPLTFDNDYEKDLASNMIRRIVKKENPDAVIYMAEAWSLILKEKELPKDLPRPSESKDRIEVVIVTIEFKTGEKFSCQARILREKDTVTLDKFDVSQDQMLMGRFVDFFKPEKLN